MNNRIQGIVSYIPFISENECSVPKESEDNAPFVDLSRPCIYVEMCSLLFIKTVR